MKVRKIVCVVLLMASFSVCYAASNTDVLEGLVRRIAPQYSEKVIFQKTDLDSDSYEYHTDEGKLYISGNDNNSMAVAFNHYLKYHCRSTVSWYASDPVQLPDVMPEVKVPVKASARCDSRFFLNYCTFGYTMPWWRWEDWERLIDWMALNGVNMPLAITGQEYVWYEVWKRFGLSDQEIRNYFTGPAHLPWHRMSNLDNWQGGLPMEWLEGQRELQKKILQREREFCMTPVLPAFAGHVPAQLKRVFPEAKISLMSSWGGFPDEYRSSFLDPLDPLFKKIQTAFLEIQTREFGTDHIYGADPFNEVMPPSWEPDFLATCSREIYGTISDMDPEAVWLQMTWLFYIDRHLWTNERIEAYLTAVPADKMILLDYYCENTEVWKQTESYFGQPYLWCYLGNFGGNTMLAGNLKEVSERIDNVYKNGQSNFKGLGSTLEGLDVNPFMYEFLFEQAWDNEVPLNRWAESLADRHIGMKDKNFRKAWQLMIDSVYVSPACLGQGTLTNARPCFAGHGNWTTNPAIRYENATLMQVWDLMLKAESSDRDAYIFDIVNVGRQVLGNHFMTLRDMFTKAYDSKELDRMKYYGGLMTDILSDMDRLLATRQNQLLGKWLDDAVSWGADEVSKAYYECNARCLITTWGCRNQSLNDYGNRSWAGLMSGYYLPRWQLFIDMAIDAVECGEELDIASFNDRVMDCEWDFVGSKEYHTKYPQGDPYEIASDIFRKYQGLIK